MRYVEFRNSISAELQRTPGGLTWRQLKERLGLPYERPCPSWVEAMEREIGLSRIKGKDRALIWTVVKDH